MKKPKKSIKKRKKSLPKISRKSSPTTKKETRSGFNWKILTAIFFIVFFSVLIYSFSLTGEWQFDDYSSIVDRYELHSISRLWPIIRSVYRPLVRLSFALNFHYFQFSTFGYHITNLVFHTFNGILVFWLGLIIFRSERFFGSKTGKNNRKLSFLPEWLSFIVAMIFIVHPVQVESVAYITSRSSLMTVFFSLICILLFHYGRQADLKARTSGKGGFIPSFFYTGSVLCFIFSIASKEIGITTPFILLAFDYFFEAKPQRYKMSLGQWLLPYIPFLLIIILGLGYRGYIGMRGWLRSNSGMNLTSGDYIVGFSKGISEILTDGTNRAVHIHFFTMLAVFASYIRILFLPVNMNIDYQFPMFSLNTKIPAQMLKELPPQTDYFPYITGIDFRPFFGLFLLIFLIYLIRRWYSTYRILSFSILFFFLAMLPVMVPILADLIFEHHLYFGVFAFGLFVVGVLDRLMIEAPLKIPGKTWNIIAILVISVMIIGFTQGSIRRSLLWNTELALWTDVIKKTPLKSRPHYNYGLAHARSLQDYDTAMIEFRKAIQIEPKIAEYHHNLGTAAYYKSEQLEELYRKTKDPRYKARARQMLQLAYDECMHALKLLPKHVEAQLGVANVLTKWGRYDEAIERYSKLIKQIPEHYKAVGNLGTAYLLKGDIKTALEYYAKSLEINPDANDSYGNMIVAYRQAGRLDLAIKKLREILPGIRNKKTAIWIKHKIAELQQELATSNRRDKR
ncbi:MAG: tetratricopeptide repeat protein [Candidatus Eremiobacteraeota bacterium]|nr:tetratricopeptide repeat protein [Candidatus Eremiobacteraeota bacterium]